MRNSLLRLVALQLFATVASAQSTLPSDGPITSASEAPTPSAPRPPVDPSHIRFVHMGGNDCPPCVVWRGLEYPKLEKSAIFQAIKYSYVVKGVTSPVPSEFFLPAELKPLKDKLDVASGRRSGSPHQALIVDDVVYDYWFGALSAADIETKIAAITNGKKYPGKRCVRRNGGKDRSCAESY